MPPSSSLVFASFERLPAHWTHTVHLTTVVGSTLILGPFEGVNDTTMAEEVTAESAGSIFGGLHTDRTLVACES